MTFDNLLYEIRDGGAWITLDRPEALNALNEGLIDDIGQALAEAEADPAARVLVLTGAGRAFCAGADLKYVLGILESDEGEAMRAFFRSASAFFARVAACEKPLIAAVNGIAAAGGMELILACDLVIAAEGARIGDAHANYGLIPGGGSSIRLARKIGPARAKYLLYTGELLPAATLAEWGLLNEVVSDAELVSAVEALVAKLAAKSPLVLRRMKRLADDGLDTPLETALRLEVAAWEGHVGAADLKEGLAAFKEKRPPAYSGR